MGYTQPPTPVVTDRSTGDGFVNDNIIQSLYMSIDINLYCVCYRFIQEYYLVYCRIGQNNIFDYVTKHHPVALSVTTGVGGCVYPI